MSLRSLLSCFQHSRTNHCPYLRTSKSYFLEVSHFLLFFFVVRNLFLSFRSLLSCFQHSRTNHCLYLRTSKSYFLEASHFLLFLLSNFFFIFMVLETITQTFFVLSLRSLLSCFQHSRTNHCPYLRTRPIIFF